VLADRAARTEHPRHQLREHRQRHDGAGVEIAAGRAAVEQMVELVALDPRQRYFRFATPRREMRRWRAVLAQQAFISVDVSLGHAARTVDAVPARSHVREGRGGVPAHCAIGHIRVRSDALVFRLGQQQTRREQRIDRVGIEPHAQDFPRCPVDRAHHTQQLHLRCIDFDRSWQVWRMCKPRQATHHPGAPGQQVVQLERRYLAWLQPHHRTPPQSHPVPRRTPLLR
jgi:hypothetical protein